MKSRAIGVRRVGALIALAAVSVTVVWARPVRAEPQGLRQDARSTTVVELKLRDDAQADLEGGTVVSRAGRNLSSVQQRLDSTEIAGATPLVGDLADDARQRFARNGRRNTSARDLASWFRIEVDNRADVALVVQELRSLPYVEHAYVAPEPAPPPATPKFESQQSQLGPAPDGLGITASNVLNGGAGKGVRIADIEYSWNTQHEDLPAARLAGATIKVGTPLDPFSDPNHGTAVLGVLAAKKNSFGVVGESYQSPLKMVNANSAEYGWNIPMAIAAAMTKLKAGDVLLLEQQTWGPNDEYVPVEWVPSIYDAIAAATAAGVIVVEAAGNDGVNLDSAIYGSPFPLGKADSGAIVVGAGSACGSPKRQRLSFSNYGSRLDVQGHGQCVVTTGYGNLFNGGPQALYTATFNGTSSASATVAGAAAALSGGYRAAVGVVASPALIRGLLKQYGTPQTTGVTGAIGPLPDVFKALVSIDTAAPAAPTNLTVTLNSSGKPVVKWKTASDNQGIKSYQVFRNGSLLTTINKATSYTDKTVAAATNYTYYLRAVDYAGHVSPPSATVSITTP